MKDEKTGKRRKEDVRPRRFFFSSFILCCFKPHAGWAGGAKGVSAPGSPLREASPLFARVLVPVSWTERHRFPFQKCRKVKIIPPAASKIGGGHDWLV